MEHSKLPWKLINTGGHAPYDLANPDRKVITSSNDERVAIVSKNGVESIEVSDANAAFIVRACNMHEKLVGSLKWAAEVVISAKNDKFDIMTPEERKAVQANINALDDLLAEAEGGE